MRRATITIPGELEEALESYLASRDARPSLTRVVQSALREYLSTRGHGERSQRLTLTPAERGSGRDDVSVEHDREISGR